MKTLKTYNDGSYMPLWQEDIAYVQNNLIEAITKIVNGFSISRTRYIVSGCLAEFDGNLCSWSAGIVMYDGELLILQATATTFSVSEIPNPVAVIGMSESYDTTNGHKLFKKSDGTWEYRETYKHRVATITVIDESDVESTDLIADGLELADLFAQKGEWLDIIDAVALTFSVKVKKQGDIVALKGAATYSSSVTTLFNLPAEYRPTTNRQIGQFLVKTDGDVTVASGISSINVDEIIYML